MRTKKIFLNMITDIIPYILIGVIGLFKVRVIISVLGDIGNGYYQTINQIITYVFLAQIGFGDALTFYLYKHFANDDKRSINRVYTGGRTIFKKLGLVIMSLTFLLSLILYLFYNFEGAYRFEVILTYLIISLSYLISYFGVGQTAQSIFTADQSKYIYSLIFNITKLLCDIFLIIAVKKTHNLISISIVILLAKILEEIIIRTILFKKYKYLKQVKNEDTKMFKMTYDIAGITINNLILNNMDAILSFIFLGPITVSIYTSYIFITRYLIEVSTKISNAVVSSFGNVLVKNETDKVYPLFMELLILFTILSFSIIICFTLGIRSFISLWINKENYILPYTTISLFSIITFIRIITLPLTSLINSSGKFKESKKQLFISMIINLIISLLLVGRYKLNGLLIGTSVSYIVYLIMRINYVEKNILIQKHKNIFINYTYIFIAFSILLFIMKYLENLFYTSLTNIITTVLILGLLFISISFLILGILSLKNKYANNLIDRCKKLLKRSKQEVN